MRVRPLGSDVVLERLEALHPKRIDLSLGRIEHLLSVLDHPESDLPPVIHVGGTNGKGSVIALLEACLVAAGHRVHSYVSPHLVRFHERIRLAKDRGPSSAIEEPELQRMLEECEAANNNAPITFFEITTAAAMLAFSRHPADILLLEVGLGGRLDATNVIDSPVVSIVTPVSIDHTQFLGDDLAGIAAEKAGILKPGATAVIGPQEEKALVPIVDRAREVGAPLLQHGVDWDFQVHDGPRPMSLELGARRLELPGPALAGTHQFANAAIAAVALLSLSGFDIDETHLIHGFRQAEWPGRLQCIKDGFLRRKLPAEIELWVDGGHNKAAGRALAETFAAWRTNEETDRPLYLITGMLNTKDVSAFLGSFAADRLAECVYGVTIHGEDASLSGDDVTKAARKAGLRAQTAASVGDAVSDIARLASGIPSRVLICGSLYLAGEILAQHT